MKVMLSAYECQPNTGSESGLGWVWAKELAAMGHEIWVVTSSDNQPSIELELQRQPKSNLHFIYCKMVSWLPWAYKITNAIRFPIAAKIASQAAKIWWQWDAYQMVKPLNQKVKFDLIHHVTNTSIRRPSFMGLLGIPFIIGPLAGGERTPLPLRKSYPSIGWLSDLFRDLANVWIQFDLLMHLTFAKASKIYCRSQQTQAFIPKPYRSKSEVLFDISPDEITETPQISKCPSTEKEIFRVLFVGRFLYWKGIHLGLQAFAQLYHKIPSSRFTVIGSGREQSWLLRLTEELGITEVVDWIPWIKRNELSSAYLEHDIFLFPSLRDSGGMVVIEALSHSLPVVCLNSGGPGVIVDETCGRVITIDGLGEETVIQSLSNTLIELAENSELRHRLSQGALTRLTKFSFKDVLKHIYPEINLTRETEKP